MTGILADLGLTDPRTWLAGLAGLGLVVAVGAAVVVAAVALGLDGAR